MNASLRKRYLVCLDPTRILSDLPQLEVEGTKSAQTLTWLPYKALLKGAKRKVRVARLKRLDAPQVELCFN